MKNVNVNQERNSTVQERVRYNTQKAKFKRVVALLCVVVMFITINSLKFEGVTLRHTATCGLEEHVHSESCYDEAGMLICGLEEHFHTDACYQQWPDPEPTVLDEYADLNSLVTLASPLSGEDEVVSSNAEDPVGEVEVELGDDTEDSSLSVEYEDATPAVEAAQPVYDLNGRDVAFLSDVLSVVEGNVGNIVSVGELTDSIVSPVSEHIIVEPVDGVENEYAVRVTQSFSQIELCIVGDEIVTLILRNGMAVEKSAAEEIPASVEQPEYVPTEATEQNDDTIIDDGTETVEIELKQTEVGTEQTEVEIIPSGEEPGSDDGEQASGDEENNPDVDAPVSVDEAAGAGADEQMVDDAQAGADAPAEKRRAILNFSNYRIVDDHSAFLYDGALNAVLVRVGEIASVDGVEAVLPESDIEGAADETLIITGNGEYEAGETVYEVTGLVLEASDGMDAAPEYDGTDAAPAEDGTNAAPAEDGTDAAPADDGTDAAPADDGTDVAPADDGTDAAPAEDGTDAAPADDGIDAAPADDGADAAPADDGTDAAPEYDGTDAAPEYDGTDAAPFDDGTDAAPTDDRTDAAPEYDGADAAPTDDGTDAAPVDDGTDAAPTDDETNTTPADEPAAQNRVALDFTHYIAADEHTAFLYDGELNAVLVRVSEIASVDGVKVDLPESAAGEELTLVITGDGEYELGGTVYAVTGLVLGVSATGEEAAGSEEAMSTGEEADASEEAMPIGEEDAASEEAMPSGEEEAPEGQAGEPAAEHQVVLDFTNYIATDDHTVFLYDSAAVAVMVNEAEIASVDGVEVSLPDYTEEDEASINEDEQAGTLVITDNGEYELNGKVYTVQNLVLPVAKVENDTITITTTNEEATLLNVEPVFEETDENYDDIFSLFQQAQDDPKLMAMLADALFGVAHAEETEVRTLQMKLFNIGLQNVESGEEIEPDTNVHIETSLEEPIAGEDFALYHIVDGKAELVRDAVQCDSDGRAVGFDFYIDSLSPFALVYYTVTIETGETYEGYSYRTEATALNAQDILGVLGIQATADSVSCSDEAVAIDGLDIALPEGFTKVVLTMVAGLDHYEVTLLAQDELEATAGDYSVTLDLSDAGLDENRVYKVEIIQKPASEEQVAAVEAALSETLENGVQKIAHVTNLEMVDISIIDMESGESVEPSGAVGVALKKGGEPVPTVVHFRGDGSIETLEVEDGRFVTESFSEFTGSYTVDFHYNGRDYSISGYSQILLSELVRILGIINDDGEMIRVADVEDVAFTSSNLVSVEKVSGLITYNGHENIDVGDKDFLLTSLAPFKTDEALFIKMNDGETVTIGVTDDVVESTELRNFLKNLTITGAQIVNGGYAVELGKDYAIHMTFGENVNTQFKNDGTLTYQLPSGVTVPQAQNPELRIAIMADGEQIVVGGDVHIATDGGVTVTFDQDDPNYSKLVNTTNVTFNIDVNVRFTEKITSSEWSAKIDKEIKIKDPEPGDVYAHKTAVYDEKTGTFSYTITVNATDAVENVNVKDVISGDALIFGGDVIVIGKSSDEYTDNQAENGFDFTFNSMAKDEVITITYSATIDTEKVKGQTRVTADQTKNTVTVQKEGGDPHSAEFSREIELKKLTKSNGSASANQSEAGKTIYDWTVEYNTNPLVSVAGAKISDSIAEGSKAYMNYYGDNIIVSVYDANGNNVEDRTVAYHTLENYSADSYKWTYVVPETDTEPYKYVIQYQTIVDDSQVNTAGNTVAINNTVTDGGQTSSGNISVTPSETTTITKAVKDWNIDERWLEWESVIHVPQAGLIQAVVTDTVPSVYRPHMGFTGYESNYESYIENSLEVTGLLEGESYAITAKDAKQIVITFYKDAEKTTPGLQGCSNGHDITIKLRTRIDEEWLAYNYSHPTDNNTRLHTNTIGINGKVATAGMQIVPPNIVKTGKNLGMKYPSNSNHEWRNGVVFEYQILVSGVTESNLVIEDKFDKTIFEVANVNAMKAVGLESMKLYGADYYGFDQLKVGPLNINYSETADGLRFTYENLPRDKDGNLYPYYRIVYYLQLRDGVNLDNLAIMNGGTYDIDNTAIWSGHETTFRYEHKYDFLKKEILQEANAANRKVQYRITYNPNGARLNGGDPVEMVDVLNEHLSLDYTSIVIETVPGNATVEYDIKGRGKDTVATYTIPDETKVVITYDATVINGSAATTNVNYVNTVTVRGETKSVDKTVTIESTAGGTGSIAHIKAVKVNGRVGSQKLSGAKFKLYTYDHRSLNTNGDTEIILTSDEDGVIDMNGQNFELFFGPTEDGSMKYYLEEIEAPEGFQLLSTPYEFTLVSDAAHVDYERYIYYSYGDSFQIKNWPLSGLVVEKKVVPPEGKQLEPGDLAREFDFEVSILNADNTVNTGYNEKNGDDQFTNGKVAFKLKHNQQKSFWGFVSGTKYKVEEKNADGYTVSVTYVDVTNVDSETGEVTTVTNTENKNEHSGTTYGRYTKVTFTNTPAERTGDLTITKNVRKNGAPDSSATGTFYYGVYSEAYSDPAQVPVRTGSITVSENGTGTATESNLSYGTYYVYELTGENGTPIISGDSGVRQVINDTVYLVTQSGTTATVGAAAGTAVLINNVETTDKTATKEWYDSTATGISDFAGFSGRATVALKQYYTTESNAEVRHYTNENYLPVTLDGTADTNGLTGPAGYESAAWTASWVNLPSYGMADTDGNDATPDEMVAFQYEVIETEASANGLTLADMVVIIDGNTVRNYLPAEIVAVKSWAPGYNPDSHIQVEFELTRTPAEGSGFSKTVRVNANGVVSVDGVASDSVTGKPWTFQWDKLPAVNAAGTAYEYSVAEKVYFVPNTGTEVDITSWYNAEVDQTPAGVTTITNTPKVKTVTVQKNWSGLPEGMTVTSVTYDVVRKAYAYKVTPRGDAVASSVVETKTLTSWDSATTLGSDYPMYGIVETVDGTPALVEYIYAAAERRVEGKLSPDGDTVDLTGYFTMEAVTAETAETATDALRMQNTYSPEKVKVVKVWKDLDNQYVNDSVVNGKKVTFRLMQQKKNGDANVGEAVQIGDTVELDGVKDEIETTEWQYQWPDQPKGTVEAVTDQAGETTYTAYTYEYSVVEEAPTDENARLYSAAQPARAASAEDGVWVYTATNTVTKINAYKIWKNVDGGEIDESKKVAVTFKLLRYAYHKEGEHHSLIALQSGDGVYSDGSNTARIIETVTLDGTVDERETEAWKVSWPMLATEGTEVDSSGKTVACTFRYRVVEVDMTWFMTSYVDEAGGTDNATIKTGAKYDDTFFIKNTEMPSYELPSTGGHGTTLFYVAGSILTLLAAVLLATEKRSDGAGTDK